MGNWGSHLYDRPPQKLGEFVQNNLRPSEDCQKQIDQTVDTICKVLQDAEQLPLVISVARRGKLRLEDFSKASYRCSVVSTARGGALSSVRNVWCYRHKSWG